MTFPVIELLIEEGILIFLCCIFMTLRLLDQCHFQKASMAADTPRITERGV